jgi:hypothetical protein
MSVSTPPQGSHTSDGIRTGPILGSKFIPGPNVLTPSVMVSSPIDQQPPGVFNTPLSLLDFFPAPTSANAIAVAFTVPAAGYVPLVAVNSINVQVITYQSIPNVLQLDSARNIIISGSAGVTASTFLVFGWDQYGVPMTEQITGPIGATESIGNKAFQYIQAVHSSAGTTANITVGVGNTFGLPYLITHENYAGVPYFNGIADITNQTTTLANNTLSTINGSSIVTLSLAGNTLGLTAADFVFGQWIKVQGVVGPVGGIPAANLQGNFQITAISIANNTLSFNVQWLATATSAGGGGAAMTLQSGPSVATGDQHTATAQTGDVRGTYTPEFGADGFSRLTLNFYSASGDGRNYNSASNGTFYLNNNPLLVNNGLNVVTVFSPNHQLTNGENVTIAGATTFGGLAVGALNITAPVTVLDANTFTYVSTANATSSAEGGGNGVSITPGYGNLYQTTTGRFGVSQYNLSPLPTP